MSTPNTRSHGRVAAVALLVLCGGASWALSVAHAMDKPNPEAWIALLVGTLPVICVGFLSHMAARGGTDRMDRFLVWAVLVGSMAMSLRAQAATVDPYMDWILHWVFPVVADVSTIVGLRAIMRQGHTPADVPADAPVHVPAEVVPAAPVHSDVPALPSVPVQAPAIDAPVHVPAPRVPIQADVPIQDAPVQTPVQKPARVPVQKPVHTDAPVHGDIEFLSRRATEMYRDSVAAGDPMTTVAVAAVLGQKSRKLAKRLQDAVDADLTPVNAQEEAQNA